MAIVTSLIPLQVYITKFTFRNPGIVLKLGWFDLQDHTAPVS